MEIKPLKDKPDFLNNKKIAEKYAKFDKLLKELKGRDISATIVADINKEVDLLNAFMGSDKDYKKQLRKSNAAIVKQLEKELKLVPKGYYQNMWMALGMTVFGLPFGTIFGMSLGNMAFLGIGLPIGMAVGIAIGSGMDTKAKEEGRQLAVDA